MSKQGQENLPSITTRKNGAGGERSSVNKEKDTALFAREVDGMMDSTKIEKGELNKIDLESMIAKTEKMVLMGKKDVKVKKCTIDTKISRLLLLPTIKLKMNMMMLRFSGFFKVFKEGTHQIPYV